MHRRASEHLEALLIEGLNSGSSTLMSASDWEDIRAAVRDRVAQRQTGMEK